MKKHQQFIFPLLVYAMATLSVQAGQVRIDNYETARRLFWDQLYAQGGETLYCGARFETPRSRGFNVEHVFPMSWSLRSFGCRTRKQCRRKSPEFNRLEADLHNLYPAKVHINDIRGSHGFGIVRGERHRIGRCDFEVDTRRRIAEPRPAVRGEIARAMFYMKDAYGMVIFGRLGRLLKEWHHADPPSQEEQRRNTVIEKIQGTRNKYIDDPRLAGKLRF